MPSQTNELSFEEAIENSLLEQGFYKGNPKDFNKEYALDEERFWHFLETTQEEELNKLKRDSNYKLKIIQRLDRMIKKYGILKLLRKGLSVDDAHFTLFYVLLWLQVVKISKKDFLAMSLV
jgi:type I restriction enzyme R subunit